MGKYSYSDCHVKRHFEVFFSPTYKPLETSNFKQTKIIRNAKLFSGQGYIFKMFWFLILKDIPCFYNTGMKIEHRRALWLLV